MEKTFIFYLLLFLSNSLFTQTNQSWEYKDSSVFNKTIANTNRQILVSNSDNTWAEKANIIQNNEWEWIELPFESMGNFYEGLALVGQNGKYGFIDKTGKIVIPCQFDMADYFSDGMAQVLINGRTCCIDKKGNIVIQNGNRLEHGLFFEGLGLIAMGTRNNKKYGFMNKTGEIVIPCQFEEAGSFHEGLAVVKQNGKWGFVDKTGKIVIPCQFESAGNFSEGLARMSQNGKDGFINKTGKIVIPCQFESAGNFSEGLAEVGQNDKYGFIDKTGKIVIPLQFDGIGYDGFNEGLAEVYSKKDKLWGFVNKTGKLIIPYQSEEANSFHEGLAVIQQNRKFGFINKTGKIVIPCQFEEASSTGFRDGVTKAKKNGKYGIIRLKSGKK